MGFVLVGIAVALLVLGGAIAGLISMQIARDNRRRLDEMRRNLDSLENKVSLVLRHTWTDAEQRAKVSATPAEATSAETMPPPEAARATVPSALDPSRQQALKEAAKAAPVADAPDDDIPLAEPVQGAAPPRPKPLAPPAEPKTAREWQDLEELIGKRWLTWAGTLVLFLGAAFFVKFAFESLGPTARVLGGLAGGTAMLLVGDRVTRRQMPVLGQGLMGGGIGILYLSFYAAFGYYELIERTAAFGAMVAVSAAAMAVAIVHDSIVVALVAMIGAFMTPALLSTGSADRDALFSYLALLDLAVLGVAFFKKWARLDTLAFLATVGYFTYWTLEYYKEPMVVPTSLWLGAFYLIFLVLPFVYQIVRREPHTLDRFLLALANAVFGFSAAYALLHEPYPKVLGFVAAGMAAGYLALGTLTRRRLADDERSVLAFIAYAMTFLTIAFPLELELNGTTLAWAVEAPLLVYLGHRFRYLPVRVGGFLVAGLIVIRLFDNHFPMHSDVFRIFLNTSFGTAAFAVAALGAFVGVHRRFGGEDPHDFDVFSRRAVGVAAGLLAGAIVHEEIARAIAFAQWPEFEWVRWYWRRVATTAVWVLDAAGFAYVYFRTRSATAYIAGLVPLTIAAASALWAYETAAGERFLILNWRFIASVLAAVAFAAYPWMRRRVEDVASDDDRLFERLLAGAAVAFVWAALSLEVYGHFQDTIEDVNVRRWVSQMALTITWALFAATVLVLGFRWQRRNFRLAALLLFGVTAVKLILVDIAGVKEIWRIAAFLGVGALMIGATYLYQRAERRLVTSTEDSGA
ncbi:MAG: DUF2339 domain-containing protein [Deltaproteobacteria bacterium]|nr:DUF2339 domain-containing protein [Deltaproteobacteria bacterium]MCB9480123.1 DUF2339 domain-containing protein [Deltaproteobacteria bacterium]